MRKWWNYKTKKFRGSDLKLIKAAPLNPPVLKIGDWVRLASGGPKMLVVDFENNKVVCAWKCDNIVDERSFPVICLEKLNG